MTKLEDDQIGRLHWKTTLEDNQTGRTKLEDDQLEDDQTGRRPNWKTNKLNLKGPKERLSELKTT